MTKFGSDSLIYAAVMATDENQLVSTGKFLGNRLRKGLSSRVHQGNLVVRLQLYTSECFQHHVVPKHHSRPAPTRRVVYASVGILCKVARIYRFELNGTGGKGLTDDAVLQKFADDFWEKSENDELHAFVELCPYR